MSKSIARHFSGIALASFSATFCFGGTPVSPQATPVPFNLTIAGPVQASGSDSRAAAFSKDYMPTFQKIVNENLSERVVFSNVEGFKLDSSKLFLRMQAKETIRVYFLAEGTGYMNTVGFAFTPAGSPTPGVPRVIYPNASVGTVRRTVNTPIRPADFVEIGKGGNGWQLDFFLIGDAFNLWNRRNKRKANDFIWYWNDIDKNSDGMQHVIAFALPDSPYILIGFEDLFRGGDRDYNDVLFVVDIGIENVVSLTDDPSTLPN